MKKLMTTTEVGNKFNVTVTTVKNWVREFNLPHERTMGGHMRFTEEQVQVMQDNIKQRWGL